ncbi:hypothetical protein CEQ83_26535 (plasmid) [Priestia megaterium]|uniref:zinc metallopeptidase n=1 Tax=Priestia megaterium TaxID=1404 RepID=UPI0012AA6F1E|nr:zinc metallopeptidase [Priestia megaterium]QFY76101.1 hypothetical protein CEQ83_26535 [Priestia megaterium]
MGTNGKIFAEELLKKKSINQKECIIETEVSNKASETIFKIKGTSRVILRGDSKNTNSIVTAAHEIGHVINNKENIKKYLRFKYTSYILSLIMILSLILVIIDKFYHDIPLGVLLIFFFFSFSLSFYSGYVKVVDEYGANKEALKLLYKYSDAIFLNHNDPRNWKNIRDEAKSQLKRGIKRYKESNFIITIFSLVPVLTYVIIHIFSL